ncbi:MAG: hypothetical protein L6R42_009940, partial [Xanthoria sp. 1 TBL-2021]
LYERPPEYKALGPVFAACYPQATPQSSARLRIVFVKLLLLALSQLHIERLTDVCYRTFPSTTHELLYRGDADVPQTIARIHNCTEYCKHVDQLVAMTRLTIDNLELEFLHAVPTTLAEYLLEVSASSSQLAQISRDNTQRYESAWMAYRDTLNVYESQGIKRLTLLATIFLPLSLSASILAMNTRFRDLHLLLFDFIGVSFLLGSLALMIYVLIAIGNRISEFIQRAEVLQKFSQTAPGSLVAGAPIPGFRGKLETSSRIILVIAWIWMTVVFILARILRNMANMNIIIIIALSIQAVMAGAFADLGKQISAPSTELSSQGQQAVLQPAKELTQPIKDSKTTPQEILLSVKDGLSTMPTDLVIHDTSLDHWSLGKALELAKAKALELDLPQVALDIEIWVKAHPWKAAFYLASAIGFFAPEILSLPALEALGFGVAGVRA